MTTLVSTNAADLHDIMDMVNGKIGKTTLHGGKVITVTGIGETAEATARDGGHRKAGPAAQIT